MRYAHQLFQAALRRPRDPRERSTRNLLESGAFVKFKEPGLSSFLPLGRRVLSALETMLTEIADKADFERVEIPMLTSNDSLFAGQEMRETFAEKILYLNDSMSGYHLITTPEMTFLDLADGALDSHRQLPIRWVYQTEIFRGVQRCEGLLKARQFKIFAGIGLDKDESSMTQSLSLIHIFTSPQCGRCSV